MSGNLKLCQVSVSKVGTKDLLFQTFLLQKRKQIKTIFCQTLVWKVDLAFCKAPDCGKALSGFTCSKSHSKKKYQVFMMRFSFIYLLVYQHLHRNLFASVWIWYITSLSQKLLISLKNCSKSCTFFGPWKNDSCKIHFSNTD